MYKPCLQQHVTRLAGFVLYIGSHEEGLGIGYSAINITGLLTVELGQHIVVAYTLFCLLSC